MKIVDYADVPAMFDQMLDEVEREGVTIEIHKDGVPMGRLEPVDEATKALFERQSMPASSAS